jgi:oligopeptide transport system permease protein
MHEQFLSYLSHLLQGDLGPSLAYPGWSVSEILWAKLPLSLELGLWGLLIAFGLGIGLGVASALYAGRWQDSLLSALSLTGICVPTFVLSPVLMLTLSLWLPLFPVFGWNGATARVLPALTLGLVYAAYVARLSRSSLLVALRAPYITTARAKGASEPRVVGQHALKNALLPTVGFLGPAAAGLLSGSFVVETVFNLPGLGRAFVQSAFNQDYFLLGGCVLVYALGLVVMNLTADCLLAWLDPRARQLMQRTGG